MLNFDVPLSIIISFKSANTLLWSEVVISDNKERKEGSVSSTVVIKNQPGPLYVRVKKVIIGSIKKILKDKTFRMFFPPMENKLRYLKLKNCNRPMPTRPCQSRKRRKISRIQ